ncbi:TAXI family TRAP transporter solute-binding subunit [Virgibacillus sp. MSP4-1]|uniref:TAXI family TRAP transporter solute-binding subunit n=1 Tax=Virgibacillus sp. MSP4-1 TaxID=2700081 RepID=UPI00039F76D0|nr:TAXI family TRAP transporter solute-binding subunit [Virgibacillus sp. MSP4-1]QHS23415.1 TAXI family TRAP transporter solute-binding subunit [Virgibacillus sp. MSP4-1]
MKKLVISMVLMVSLSIVLAACGGSETSSDEKGPAAPSKFLKVGSGPMGSGWYPITTVMVDVYMDGFSSLNVSQLEGGSTSNLESLEKGDIQMGLNYTSDFTSALEGGKGFDKPLKNISAIAALYPVYQTIATTTDHEDIHSIEDIVDKHIFLGPKGGGGPVAFWKMMEEYGIDEQTIEEAGGKISYGNYSDGASMLKDNNVDVFVGGGAPFIPALQEIEITKPIKVLPIDEEKLQSIKEKGVGIASGDLPAGTYKGQDEAIPTYTMVTMLTARSDIEEDYAYNLTKIFWDNIPKFEDQIPKRAKHFTKDTALDGINPENLHPGAKKYYQEAGVLE